MGLVTAHDRRRLTAALVASVVIAAACVVLTEAPAGAAMSEIDLQNLFGNAAVTSITLTNDVTLTCPPGGVGDLLRNSPNGLTITGNGFTITQTCAGERVMTQIGSGALILNNLTLTGGDSSGDGGAINTFGDITLTNAVLTGNTAVGIGGGVRAVGDITATGSTISGNTGGPGASGGGLAGLANVTVTDSTVSDNHGGNGGGVLAGGTLSVVRSVFTGNTAALSGGGAYAHLDATIVDSAFSGNDAGASNGGGGIQSDANITVTGSTFDSNTAGEGGGIGAQGTVTLTNSTITGNTAVEGGGEGGGVSSVTAVLVYATVVDNTAPTGANFDLLFLESFGSVVALPQGGGLNCDIGGGGSSTSHGYNFSDDTSCGFTASTDTQGATAGDPQLGTLADNGGPTATRLPLEGSPLIDAIPNSACQSDGASGVTTDQRGVTRPQRDGCDIGAVEVEPPPPPLPAPAPVATTITFTG